VNAKHTKTDSYLCIENTHDFIQGHFVMPRMGLSEQKEGKGLYVADEIRQLPYGIGVAALRRLR
jgi:hypothetical protein